MAFQLAVSRGSRSSVAATHHIRSASSWRSPHVSQAHHQRSPLLRVPGVRRLASSASSGASPVANALIGGGLLATAGAAITLFYAHESEAFRAMLRENAPMLNPVWDLVTPAARPEPRPITPPAPRQPSSPPAPVKWQPKSADETKKEQGTTRSQPQPEKPVPAPTHAPVSVPPPPVQPASEPAADVATATPAATADREAAATSAADTVIADLPSAERRAESTKDTVDNALLAGIEAPAVPAAVSATRSHGHGHAAQSEHADSSAPVDASTTPVQRHEEVRKEDVSSETSIAAAAADALATAEAVTAAVISAAASAAQPSTPAVHSAGASPQADAPSTSSSADQFASTTATTSTTDGPDATSESGTLVTAVVAEDPQSVILLAETQAALLQAESRVQELERQLQVQMAGEIRRREAQRDADALNFQHALNDERVRAKEHLAAEVAAVRADYEKILATETAAVREHYLRELQEHVQIQQKIHEQDIAKRSVDLTKKIKEESESDLNIRVGRERAARLAQLETHFQRLKAVEGVLASRADLEVAMGRTAALATATAGLREALDASKPLRAQVETVLAACSASDDAVLAIVGSIPSAVLDAGAAPLAETIHRFAAVKAAVRRLALVPDHATLVDHALAAVAAAITFEKKGLVPGDDVEAVLARAEHYITAANVEAAARELAQLRGAAGRVAHDWVVQVRTRLEAAQAVSLLDAYVNLQNLSVA